MSLRAVQGVVILDADGKRLVAKYYSTEWPTHAAQVAFEANLFQKTHRANSEILMWENAVTVYRSCADVLFYVIGTVDENELMLMSVLTAYYETVAKLLQGAVDSTMILDNLDYVLLALDEIVDNGVILESDPSVVAGRVAMRGLDNEASLSEQNPADMVKTVTETFKRSFLQ